MAADCIDDPTASGEHLATSVVEPLDCSPMPTELDLHDDIDVVHLDDSPAKCFCHLIVHPDAQPSSPQEFLVCDVCKLQQLDHPDDVPTEIDEVAMEDAAASMIQESMDQVGDLQESLDQESMDVDDGECEPSPDTRFRRMKAFAYSHFKPIVVDSPGSPEVCETLEDCYIPDLNDGDDLVNADENTVS